MICPSTFTGFGDKSPKVVDWTTVHHYLIDPNSFVRQCTELSRDARARGDNKEAARLKHRCGAFTPSVQAVGGHRAADIIAMTRCCITDTDHISREEMDGIRQKAITDPHTMLGYTTNSQAGWHNIYRWQAEDAEGNLLPESFFTWNRKEDQTTWLERMRPYHEAAFLTGNQYYANLFGYDWDTQTADPNRLSLYCYDPRAHINLGAEPFVVHNSDVERIRQRRCARNYGNSETRNFGISQAQSKPDSWTFQAQPFPNFRISELPDSPFTLAESMVKAPYAPGTYNRHVMLTCYRLCELGISEQETAQWAVQHFSDYDPKAVKAIVRSCYLKADFGSHPYITREEYIRRKQML